MTAAWRLCAVVPTFDNPRTVSAVVDAIPEQGLEVVLVDDGSGHEGQSACEAVGRDGRARVVRLSRNSGKGAAVHQGFEVAGALGFTHAFQIDADGQHDVTRIPAFAQASRESPETLVIGYPEYDESVPRLRRSARRVTDVWVAVEVGGRDKIRDARACQSWSSKPRSRLMLRHADVATTPGSLAHRTFLASVGSVSGLAGAATDSGAAGPEF